MLEFIAEYWLLAVALAAFAAAMVILVRKGYTREAKAVALSLVAGAEERFGSGTGEIKYSAVAAALYSRLPYAARLLIDEKNDLVNHRGSRPQAEKVSFGRRKSF